jgi:hypothetical protein
MKIKSDTRIYLSEIGAKGFLYPSESFVLSPKEFNIEKIPYVCDSASGVVPVRIMADVTTNDDRLSIKESSIFWVEKRKIIG